MNQTDVQNQSAMHKCSDWGGKVSSESIIYIYVCIYVDSTLAGVVYLFHITDHCKRIN